VGRLRRYARKVRKRLWPVAAVAAVLAFGAILMLVMVFGADDEPAIDDPPACFEGPVTPGIDVSYYQGTVHWKKVQRAGIRFAFIRVSDGLGTRDPMFERNWAGAKQARIRRGAYQYFRPEESAIAQADLVIAALARDPGELPPVVDVEATGGKSPKQIERQIRAWVGRIRSKLGVEPIVYTSPAFWRDSVGSADLSSQPLWLAHYTDGCPRIPPPWAAWTFWQHSETGRVPGISGPVDLNVMAGELPAP
jgi:lysozyme